MSEWNCFCVINAKPTIDVFTASNIVSCAFLEDRIDHRLRLCTVLKTGDYRFAFISTRIYRSMVADILLTYLSASLTNTKNCLQELVEFYSTSATYRVKWLYQYEESRAALKLLEGLDYFWKNKYQIPDR